MLFFDYEPDGQVEHRLQRGDRLFQRESGLDEAAQRFLHRGQQRGVGQPTPGEQAASVTVGQQSAPQHPSGFEQQLTPTSDRLQHQVAPHGGRHLVE
nr:hypothetical protein [Micropruina glycogenica]